MKHTRAGLGYGFGAYLIWGSFPIYFGLIAMVSPLEVVPWRVVTALIFSGLLVTFTKRWLRVWQILRTPRLLGWFALSAVMLYANWQIFIIGVMTGHVVETSLGYFINPLLTILIGVVVRRERLTRLQVAAVGIATIGVIVAAVGYGSFPWIALSIAVTFGLYGAIHKHVAENIDGLTGLAAETLLTLPIAAVQLAIIAVVSGVSAFSFGPGVAVLVLFSGVMTAVPLILFGEAARRLPLTYLGFLQFLTPVLSFLYGTLVLGEEISTTRLVGFIGVWIALALLITEMVRSMRRSPEAEPTTGLIPLD